MGAIDSEGPFRELVISLSFDGSQTHTQRSEPHARDITLRRRTKQAAVLAAELRCASFGFSLSPARKNRSIFDDSRFGEAPSMNGAPDAVVRSACVRTPPPTNCPQPHAASPRGDARTAAILIQR